VSVALGVDMFDCVYPTRTAVSSFSDDGFDSIEIWKCHHSAWSSQFAK
jgi:queuine/archaeosine tRNA-ribosyltransferase